MYGVKFICSISIDLSFCGKVYVVHIFDLSSRARP